MSLFGSGPRSNILQTVAPMYQGIVNAEKQKGASMREAMGAFGQAIDPKTIAMKKFKKDFANADWNKPETYMRAGQAIFETDPTAGLGFIQKGQALAASQAPKRDMQLVNQWNAETQQMEQVAVDMSAVHQGTVFGAGKQPKSSTAMAQRITEAFGYEVGTPEHKAEMQKAIDSQNTVKNIPSAIEQVRIVKGDVEKNKRYQDMTATAAMIDDGKALIPAVKAGNAKAGVILERIGSQLSTSGVRAVSEIQRYTESGSWSQRMGDWINRGFKGTPSDISIEETEKLLNLLNDKNNTRMNLLLDHQAEVFSSAMKDEGSVLLRDTINAFRPEPDKDAAVSDVTKGITPIPNAPSGLEEGTYMDAKGNKIQVINGVAYEF